MNEENDALYTDYVDYLADIIENQQLQIEQTNTVIAQNETIISQNEQILTFVSYLFVLVLAMFVARIFAKVLSVIDGA